MATGYISPWHHNHRVSPWRDSMYHVSLLVGGDEADSVCRTITSLGSFIRIQIKSLGPSGDLISSYREIDVMIGEMRDVEWLMLKCPNLKFREIIQDGSSI